MKNKLKLLTVGIGLLFIPFTVEAATLTFEGEPVDSTATYEIKYNPQEAPIDTISLKIDKTNDDLTYDLVSEYGTCSKLECTLITTQITTEATIATLKVSNLTTESKETTITIGGTLPGSTKTFTLKAGSELTTTAPKNSDATLSGISVSIGTMDQPFNKEISTYNVTGIKDTINLVRVIPECDNNCYWTLACPNGDCTIKDGTSVNLQMGANQVSIFVESEDLSTKKTYVLNIYRGEIEVNSAYLSNINIKNSTLSPAFDSMTNDYTAIVGLDVDKLELEAIAEDPNANIVIKGNENLIEGENTITITVTSSDGQNKQVYTIIVTKEKIEEDEKEEKKPIKTNKVEKKKNNTLLIVIISIVGLGLIIGGYLLIFKLKKKKKDNNKNDKNNPSGTSSNQEESLELTTKQKIEEITKEIELPNMDDEPKQDIDEALDDLMKTKKLELGDLDF